jgi:hypothetical protein
LLEEALASLAAFLYPEKHESLYIRDLFCRALNGCIIDQQKILVGMRAFDDP